MKFYYQAIDSLGSKVNGTLDSGDPDSVAEILEKKGLVPIRVQSSPFAGSKKQKRKKSLFGSNKVSGKERVLFIRQMATLLDAGCPVTRAFDMIIGRADSEATEKLAVGLRDDVEGGMAISEAMGKHKDVFSEMHIGMAAAGDEGGFLPEALGQIASYEEGQAKLKGELIQAITYPAFMIAVMLISCLVLFKFVVPSILGVVLASGGELPLPTKMLIAISDGISDYSTTVILVGAVAFYAYKSYIDGKKGRIFHDTLLLNLPIIGSITRKVIISRLCKILAMLSAGGVSIVRALEISASTAQNVVVETDVASIVDKVKGGDTLSDCFETSYIFPAYVSGMVQLGEETGKLDSMLSRIALEYEEEYQMTLKSAVGLVEPMMIAVMGLVVGFVVVAVFMPMANMSASVG
jgi:type IV pilus assembly protein PilC